MRRSTLLLSTTSLVSAALAAAALGTAVLPGAATAEPSGKPGLNAQHFELGLFGDVPYGPVGRAQFPALVDSINNAKLAFTVFDGDTKNGSEPCYADPHATTDTATPEKAVADADHPDVYKLALSRFAMLQDPVVYTPGDNEWTDCDRPSTAGGAVSDSSDRLAYLRRLSYPTDQSLGQRTLTVTRQSAAYPENQRWTYGPATFAVVNVTGSDNNFADGGKNGPAAEGQAEYAARNAANLAWIKEVFAAAKDSAAVMIALQADMWDPTATLTHFADTKAELARQAIAFGKPVVLVNGDSHSFESDKPLLDAKGQVIENVTRVTTFGDAQNHWVSASVDANDPNVFTFHQHLVGANLPAYVAP